MDDLIRVKSTISQDNLYESHYASANDQLAGTCEFPDIEQYDQSDINDVEDTDEIVDSTRETNIPPWIECGFVKPLLTSATFRIHNSTLCL